MKKPVVLVYGLDDILRQSLKSRLVYSGFKVIEASEQSDPSEQYRTVLPDIVIISSYRKSFGNGIKVIKKVRQIDKNASIIFIVGKSSEARAIAAIKAGVDDYFKSPFSCEALAKSAKRILSTISRGPIYDEVSKHESSKIGKYIIGESKRMREIKSYLLKVARSESTVFITGETGTGKELAANLVHFKSPRYRRPFVCINCAALPESLIESELFGYDRGAFTGAIADKPGKFEMASKGTVFLDEIGDMNHYAQAKILRSIESREFFHLGGKRPLSFNARVIAATNKDPAHLIEQRKMREDLYYRLNVARIHLPPLRERKEDIPLLISHAAMKLNRRFGRNVAGLTEEATKSLLRYDWPGNIRELFNLLEAMYINLPSRHRDFIDLPKTIQNEIKEAEMYTTDERKQIVSTLLETNWNKSTAAQKLNWSRMTLYRKMEKYNIVELRSRERRIH